MTTKKTIRKVLKETSESPLKIARKDDGEPTVVSSNAEGAADSLPDAAPAARETRSEPVPNVQSEPNHASQAPEDTRDASVAEPNH